MVEQIGLNDPIELLMDGPRGNVLVEALSEVARWVREIATLVEAGALPPRGPRVGIYRSRHVEMRSEGLFIPDEQGLGGNVFVSRGFKRVINQTGSVGWRDQGNKLGSDCTPRRIVGRDDVRQPRDGESGRGIKAVAVPHRDAVYRPGSCGVENLSCVDRPSQSIGCDRRGGIQKLRI